MKKRALITGVMGQDGRHLVELLTSKDYEVFGLIHGQNSDKSDNFQKLYPNLKIVNGDLTDFSSLIAALEVSNPDEIYNLAAMSHVGQSFKVPELTANVTGLGLLRLLDAVRALRLTSKIYQASSSEMFGKVRETPQTEMTPFHPRSPYGSAKSFAHYTATNYREAYGLHISCGILFNHEGEYRGHEFVTRKITSSVAKIALGIQSTFALGDISPKRDWGYAGDYVQAMWLMLQQNEPDDYVIATGKTFTVEDFLIKTLIMAGLEDNIDKYVIRDQNLSRPTEVDYLVGDATKAKSKLNWVPTLNLDELISRMLKNDLKLISDQK